MSCIVFYNLDKQVFRVYLGQHLTKTERVTKWHGVIYSTTGALRQHMAAVKQARSSWTAAWPDDSIHLGELVGHGRVVGTEPVTAVVHSKEMSNQDIPVVPHHCQNQQQVADGEMWSTSTPQGEYRILCIPLTMGCLWSWNNTIASSEHILVV